MKFKKCPKCGHSIPVFVWIHFKKCPQCHLDEFLEELRKLGEIKTSWRDNIREV